MIPPAALPAQLLPSIPLLPYNLLPIVPSLSPDKHKGQTGGKLLTLGSSPEYFGAGMFAASAMLRAGGDMAHVLTLTEAAGSAIRANSKGELMVFTPEACGQQTCQDLLSRMDGVCVGPGLSRSDEAHDFASFCCDVIAATPHITSIVVDADGLFAHPSQPRPPLTCFQNDPRAILTPNIVEFRRLTSRYCPPPLDSPSAPVPAAASSLLSELGVGAIVVKGRTDHIVTPTHHVECAVNGGLKRCGGLGDVLAGVTCLFATWLRSFERGGGEGGPQLHEVLYAACAVARESSRRAFVRHGRSTSAPHVVGEVGGVCEELFPPW